MKDEFIRQVFVGVITVALIATGLSAFLFWVLS